MGIYGTGRTMGQKFNMDKERIKHALNGELAYSKNENGFIYRPAPIEECESFILKTFDNVVYHLLEMTKFGRIYDYLLEKNGIKYSMQDIMIGKAIEDCKPDDYQYEED